MHVKSIVRTPYSATKTQGRSTPRDVLRVHHNTMLTPATTAPTTPAAATIPLPPPGIATPTTLSPADLLPLALAALAAPDPLGLVRLAVPLAEPLAPVEAEAEAEAPDVDVLLPTRPTPYARVEAPSRAHLRPDMTWLINVSFCHAATVNWDLVPGSWALLIPALHKTRL
jgi:hypothetical protein